MLRQVLKLIEQNEMTLEQAAQYLSRHRQKISAESLNRKLLNGNMKLNDLQILLDILGYKMVIRKDL